MPKAKRTKKPKILKSHRLMLVMAIVETILGIPFLGTAVTTGLFAFTLTKIKEILLLQF